jgi:5-formyltetrahydrofolate cyclo-ligase
MRTQWQGHSGKITRMAMSKAALRQRIRKRRPGDSNGLTAQLISLLGEAQTVASYSPMASEPDTAEFNDWVQASGRRLLLPEISGQNLLWREPGELLPGRFGVLAPTGALASLRAAQLVVIPALAADRAGVRLGQGGGYYDRALADLGAERSNSKLVAVVFDTEFFETLPREEHDITVDLVVSPTQIWRAAQQ